jgi:hypothetical protein
MTHKSEQEENIYEEVRRVLQDANDGSLDKLKFLENIAFFLDSAVTIPYIGVSVGLDSVIGCLPVVGDIACFLPSLYIVFTAQGMGAPQTLVFQMLLNILIDAGSASKKYHLTREYFP